MFQLSMLEGLMLVPSCIGRFSPVPTPMAEHRIILKRVNFAATALQVNAVLQAVAPHVEVLNVMINRAGMSYTCYSSCQVFVSVRSADDAQFLVRALNGKHFPLLGNRELLCELAVPRMRTVVWRPPQESPPQARTLGVCIEKYLYMYTHMYIYIYMRVYRHKYIHRYTHIYSHTYTYV